MPPNAVDAAHRSAARGHVAEALQILKSAGDAGDAGALAELAVWYLKDGLIPRDLACARRHLRQAVAIGHVDAALMEIALTANGSGSAANWAEAVKLLERAAARDPVASQHLELLRRMKLDPDGAPLDLPSSEMLSTSPRIQRFAGFCTLQEAAHVASTVIDMLEPSTVVHPETGRHLAHPIRSSDHAAIGPTRETLVIQAINRRIAAATATLVDQGEPLTVLRYAPGQQYRLHLDTLPNEPNQRILTGILYLNHGYEGGTTDFPLAGVNFRANAGDLLVFDNLDLGGMPNPLSRHAGLPVLRGTKWIATRWIRATPTSPWALSTEARAALSSATRARTAAPAR